MIWTTQVVEHCQGLSGVVLGNLGFLLTALVVDTPFRCRHAVGTLASLFVYIWLVHTFNGTANKKDWPWLANLVFFAAGSGVQLILHHAAGGRACCCCCDDFDDGDIDRDRGRVREEERVRERAAAGVRRARPAYARRGRDWDRDARRGGHW